MYVVRIFTSVGPNVTRLHNRLVAPSWSKYGFMIHEGRKIIQINSRGLL